MSIVIGWDIGGVHLKAARAEDGRVTKVAQYASPLRSGTERLLQAFAEAKKDLGRADRHVITMTGELADTFSSRAEGVEQLASLAARELGGVQIYAGPAGYVGPEDRVQALCRYRVGQLARLRNIDRTYTRACAADRLWLDNNRHRPDLSGQAHCPRIYRRAAAGGG